MLYAGPVMDKRKYVKEVAFSNNEYNFTWVNVYFAQTVSVIEDDIISIVVLNDFLFEYNDFCWLWISSIIYA